MELLLHHAWRQRLFPLGELRTTSGQVLEILDTGLHNHDAGPDFFNAKIKLDGQLWVGNVELHTRSSDWLRHGHQQDEHYNNVVLHVVEVADAEVRTQSGQLLPQWVLPVPQGLRERYDQLLQEERYPPCHRTLSTLSPLHVHAWLTALAFERLEAKTERIDQWLSLTAGDWEHTFFIALARAFGFGKNTEAFELWARSIQPQHIAKHRDHPLQIEAFFFGQAGLLEEKPNDAAQGDAYFLSLQSEYAFLRHKFQLQPISSTHWKFLRLRPQNFPYRRLAQLAQLYSSQRLNFSLVRQAKTVEQLRDLLRVETPPYWTTRYTFAPAETSISSTASSAMKPRNSSKNTISSSSIDLLMINAIAPLLMAYGKAHQDTTLTERAYAWLEALAPERNAIVSAWSELGITAQHAADSQALLHLRTRYCDRRDCLRCRFGQHYLKCPNP